MRRSDVLSVRSTLTMSAGDLVDVGRQCLHRAVELGVFFGGHARRGKGVELLVDVDRGFVADVADRLGGQRVDRPIQAD